MQYHKLFGAIAKASEENAYEKHIKTIYKKNKHDN